MAPANQWLGHPSGLVESPEQWRWSSYRLYFFGEAGAVRVNVGWTEISFRDHVV